MSGFQDPNYTQTPNELFDSLMKNMDLAELKVVMAVIRYTFGYHRFDFTLSLKKMADLTGLSESSVIAGATAAEEHGLIRRVVNGKRSTTWVAVTTSNIEAVYAKSTPNSEAKLPQKSRQFRKTTPKNGEQTGLKKEDKERKIDLYPLAQALASVGGIDLEPNKEMLLREAKMLARSTLEPTPALITERYAPGGWWYKCDWRGKKGQRPKPSEVRATWGTWKDAAAPGQATPAPLVVTPGQER
jgi:hypothetical protein